MYLQLKIFEKDIQLYLVRTYWNTKYKLENCHILPLLCFALVLVHVSFECPIHDICVVIGLEN